MKKVLIIGGGYSGSVIADELSKVGVTSYILEKSNHIGGKVRDYGCKAEEECTNCGMCLVKDLFSRVEKNKKITIINNAEISDVFGKKGDFKVFYQADKKSATLEGITDIVVSTGFKDPDKLDFYGFQVPVNENIIRGHEMESLMRTRDSEKVFDKAPEKVAFVQCFGSRDKTSKMNYCSKICCNYSTRMARVIRKYYPETQIDMYCMDMQQVEKGKYLELLKNKNINLIKSRPTFITEEKGKPVVRYEAGANPEKIYGEYDLLFLTDGIPANPDNDEIGEILGLHVNKAGFLKEVSPPELTGIFVSGCAYEPMGIADTYKMSLDVAARVKDNK